MSEPSRRRLLISSAAVAGGTALAGLAVAGSRAVQGAPDAPRTTDPGLGTVAFFGAHQAGVDTPAPAHATFVALDLAPGTDADAVRRLMRILTQDAALLSQGRPALADTDPDLAQRPAELTVTFGWGPAVFDLIGKPDARPAGVAAIPAMPGDQLAPQYSGGDVLIQVCAQESATVSHAVRTLLKQASAFGRVRWVQQGSRQPSQAGTGRNLLGQIDGTVNPQPGTPEFEAAIWHQGDPAWFAGGTVAVIRRIAFGIEAWDALRRETKEAAIGRRLDNGAPLTGNRETDQANLDAMQNGRPVIAADAHIRLARAVTPAETLLRRGYNYDLGPLPDGRAQLGLIFVAYQKDPATSFIPVQKRLATSDALNTWVTHTGSAVFAILPGCQPGEFAGQSLLGA